MKKKIEIRKDKFKKAKKSKIKMIGFKVGDSRPTANKTVEIGLTHLLLDISKIGQILLKVLEKSDFISIRKVKNGRNKIK